MPTPTLLVNYGFHTSKETANAAAWAGIPAQYASSASCSDCHQAEYAFWQTGDHRSVNCEDCHGPSRQHLETGIKPVLDKSRDLCGTCHAELPSRPADFPQVDMNEMGGTAECIACHNPHEPRAGMPPKVPHSLDSRQNCLVCHGDHEPWSAPPPVVPHTLEGRTDCLSCHDGNNKLTISIPKIPHSLDGRKDCLTCHNSGSIKPFPADHSGRTSSTCLNCHRSS